VSYVSIPPDDYERALAPVFGSTVAFEVASQVRYIIDRGDGSVDMTDTVTQLGVQSTPLDAWIRQHSWDA
jgi:NAD(P)H dehydrogenase (quinone)